MLLHGASVFFFFFFFPVGFSTSWRYPTRRRVKTNWSNGFLFFFIPSKVCFIIEERTRGVDDGRTPHRIVIDSFTILITVSKPTPLPDAVSDGLIISSLSNTRRRAVKLHFTFRPPPSSSSSSPPTRYFTPRRSDRLISERVTRVTL